VFEGNVTQMWRWPVKGLRGETVRSAVVGRGGMAGDRMYAVFEATTGEGRWAGGDPRLLAWEAAWPAQCGCADGTGDMPVLYDPSGGAWAVDDTALGEALTADLHSDEPLELRPVKGTGDRILMVFEASLKALGAELGRKVEVERFRPNVLVETDAEPFAEQFLEPGTPIRIGETEFTVSKPCVRCVLPSWDPFGRERDKELHRLIVTGHDNLFGVYLTVEQPATIAVGDAVVGRA
jgi:uncharacterized protein